MADYIKINNEWVEIYAIHKKVNGQWVIQNATLPSLMSDGIYFYNSTAIDTSSYDIDGPNTFVGKSFNLVTIFNNRIVFSTWSITSGSQYATINSNGKVSINEGVQNQSITVQATYQSQTATITINISYDNQLSIDCSSTITGTYGNAIARYNSTIVTPTWSIISGNAYAAIDSTGRISIASTGTITIQAVYNNYTTTKNVDVVYDAGTTTTTEVDENGTVTTTTTTTTTDPQTGATTETTTTTSQNDDGSMSVTESETTTNQDGSSTSSSTTTNSDGSSSQNETTVNSDGSSTSQTTTQNADGTSQQSQTDTASDGSSATTTTNYDENGDPTSGTNNTIDTSGNSNTQEITYDENGNTTVTAYTIDTTGNEAGTGETITGTGVNTEFFPFDGSSGFEMHIRFYSRKQDQPNPPIVEDTEDKGSNYHFTILCAKDPRSPYPGFHIRWTLSKTNYNSGNLVLGYRGRTGSATNRNLSLAPTTGDHANTYDFTISYDPELKKYPSKFRCVDNLNGGALITLNIDFNALDYECTLGYNINQSGQPYRYSNVTIYEFSITKI